MFILWDTFDQDSMTLHLIKHWTCHEIWTVNLPKNQFECEWWIHLEWSATSTVRKGYKTNFSIAMEAYLFKWTVLCMMINPIYMNFVNCTKEFTMVMQLTWDLCIFSKQKWLNKATSSEVKPHFIQIITWGRQFCSDRKSNQDCLEIGFVTNVEHWRTISSEAFNDQIENNYCLLKNCDIVQWDYATSTWLSWQGVKLLNNHNRKAMTWVIKKFK